MRHKDSPSDILREIANRYVQSPVDILDAEDDARDEREELSREALENELLEQYITLQRTWSRIIGGLLYGSSLAIWGLIFSVGLGKLDFTAYPWLMHTIVGSFFAQIVGLGHVVAKYLFLPAREKRSR